MVFAAFMSRLACSSDIISQFSFRFYILSLLFLELWCAWNNYPYYFLSSFSSTFSDLPHQFYFLLRPFNHILRTLFQLVFTIFLLLLPLMFFFVRFLHFFSTTIVILNYHIYIYIFYELLSTSHVLIKIAFIYIVFSYQPKQQFFADSTIQRHLRSASTVQTLGLDQGDAPGQSLKSSWKPKRSYLHISISYA